MWCFNARDKWTLNTSQKLSVRLRAVTTSGRVGMCGTGHVFSVVSILLRYKSGPNLFAAAWCLTVVLTGDVSYVSLLAGDNRRTLHYEFQGAGCFIFHMKIILINVHKPWTCIVLNISRMKDKLTENTESLMVIPRVTQIPVMTLKTTESILRETNEQTKPSASKERQ